MASTNNYQVQGMLRDKWVDYARGLGILLVVYGHVARGVFNAGIGMDARTFALIDSLIYSFHMPLFFFLSGLYFLPSMEKHGRLGLIHDKFGTLIYPYVVWSLLQGGIEVALSRFTNLKIKPEAVLALLWHPRAQFWFLYVLFVIFVVAAVFYRSDRRLSAIWLPLAITAWVSQLWLDWVFPLNFLATDLVFFVAGASFPRWSAHLAQRPGWWVCFIVPVFVALAWLFHIQLGLTFTSANWLRLPLALSGILATCAIGAWLAKADLRGARWLAVCGLYSMPIFLAHILAGSGVRIVLSKVLKAQSIELHLILGMLAATLLPIFLYRLSRRPTFNWLGALFSMPARKR